VVYNSDDLNTFLNLGGGLLYWCNDTIGLRGTALGKFALNISDNVYENNHFQYKLELIIKL